MDGSTQGRHIKESWVVLIFIYMKILVTESQLRVIKEMAVSAYHGTPHSIDKFDIEKVGSGESSQWFGWGLYFTDVKDIGDWYAKSVGKSKSDESVNKISLYVKGVNVGVEYTSKYMQKKLNKPYPGDVMKKFPGGAELYEKDYNIYYQVIPEFIDSLYTYKEYENRLNSKKDFTPEQIKSSLIESWERRSNIKTFIDEYLKELKDSDINRIDSFKFDIERLTKWKSEIENYSDENLEYMVPSISVDGINKETPIYDENGTFNPIKQKQVLINKLDKRIKEYEDVIVKVKNKMNQPYSNNEGIKWLINTFGNIQPSDVELKGGDPIKKSYVYHVTLHKGKTPDEYDWISWVGNLTDSQKQKILTQVKKDKIKNSTFYLVSPDDEESFVQPAYFRNFSDAKEYAKRKKTMTPFGFEVGGHNVKKMKTDLINDLNLTGEQFYSQLSGLLDGPRNASMFLLKSGIDGIKYPTDTNTTRDSSRGFNYVVFDPTAVSIEKKDEIDIE